MACYFRPDLLLEELSEQYYWSLVADPRSLFLTIVGRVLTMETYETYKVRYGDEVIKIELGHFFVVRSWA